MFVLTCAGAALALTSPQSGPGVEVTAGLGLADAPVSARLGAAVSAGWWFGHYDDQYSLGRYTWIGPTVRAEVLPGDLRVAPMLELRRGIDLVVAGVAPFVAGGPLLAGDALGGTARAGVVAKFRRTRHLGFVLRLEAGADFLGGATFSGGALLGVAFSRPL
jgi:hypothetical protein